MALEQYANAPIPSSPTTPWTTLSAGVDAVTTTIPVVGFAAFPSAVQYRILVDNELMLVTGGAGTTSWTVTRGVEGSTAAVHASGAGVFHGLTKAGFLGNPLALTTSGDTPYLNASLQQARLSAPSDGDYLMRWATAVPSWVSPATAGLLTAATAAATYQPIGSYATLTGAETLTNKTLTTPTIASFANATHTHLNAAGGGTLTAAAISDLGSAAVVFTNKTGNISQWTNDSNYLTSAGLANYVTGPASAVDNAIARFNGTTGKIIQDYTSGAPTISDTGTMTFGAGSSSRLWDLSTVVTGEAITFGYIYNQNPFASGGLGNEAYIDDVMAWGWNLSNTVASPGVAGKASTYYVIENKFFWGGKYQAEVHLEHIDTAGVIHRVSSYGLPHDGGTGASKYDGVDVINWADWAGTARMQWNLLEKVYTVADSGLLRFSVNNTPIISQLSSVGTYINLPYINNEDRMVFSQPFAIVGGAAPAGGSYPTVWGVMQPSSAVANDTLLELNGPTLTGAYTALDATGAPTTELKVSVRNSRTSATGAHAIFYAETTSTGGDALIHFGNTDGFWRCGLDNSDGAKFKWAKGGSLGSSVNVLTIDHATSVFYMRSTGAIGFGIDATGVGTPDTLLYRDASGEFAQRNTTSAQKMKVYNTFTTVDTAGEWFAIDWKTTANVCNLQAVNGSSSGTARVLNISYGGPQAAPLAAISIPITSGAVGMRQLAITEAVGASALTLTGATQTASFPVLTATQTWNNAGVTFTALKANVTDTASAAASLLLDLQVAGAAKFSVRKDGQPVIYGTFRPAVTETYDFGFGGLTFRDFFGRHLRLQNASSTISFGASNDVSLTIDSSVTLAQRTGTTAQRFRLYNTFTTVNTAGEWWKQDWITTTNQFRFGTVMGTSTGTARVASWDYGGLEASPTAAIKVDLIGTGITICSAVTEKLGFYGVTPIVQGASVADASGGAIIDAEARVAINALISRIEASGLIATV